MKYVLYNDGEVIPGLLFDNVTEADEYIEDACVGKDKEGDELVLIQVLDQMVAMKYRSVYSGPAK
jgi:hypothetical protein